MARVDEKRLLDAVDAYAHRQPVDARDALRDVYLRAYRRAGLLPGDPDELTTTLPAAPQAPPTHGHSGTPEDPSTGRTAASNGVHREPAIPPEESS